jgi:hypothetical protein
MWCIYMTHKIINKNIINIKIENKKHKPKKDKKYKHKKYDNHVNASYNPVATQQTNRPQYLDTSTATTREKEGIVNQAIMDVKKSNDILLLKDKENNNLDKPMDHTPKTARMIQTDIRSPVFFNNRLKENSGSIDEIYSNNEAFENDNVMEIPASKRGRPLRTGNDISNEQLKMNIERNKKQNEKYHENKSINPMHIMTRSKELGEKTKKNAEKNEKFNDKISDIFNQPDFKYNNKLHGLLKTNDANDKRDEKLIHQKSRMNSTVSKLFTSPRQKKIHIDT